MKIYEKYYICSKSSECNNRMCFMRHPRRRIEYARNLGRLNTKKTIEEFNTVFTCDGQPLKLLEIEYTNKLGVDKVI